MLLHEYAHHFMALNYPAYYPAWFREGFAEYMMTARFRDRTAEFGKPNPGRAMTLLGGTWLPVERIVGGGKPLASGQLGQFYAQSWLMVHYLFATPDRQAAFTRYLADLHRGVAEPTAFRSAFRMDHAAFDQVLKAYLRGSIGYSVIAWTRVEPASLAVRPLSAASDDVLLVQAAVRLGMSGGARELQLLEQAKAASSKFPGDPIADTFRVRAEISFGDRAAGTEMADRLITASGATVDPELFYLRGLGDFFTARNTETGPATKAALFARARPWFEKAVAADPTYYTARYRLAQTMDDEDSALPHLMAAQRQAPLIGDMAVDTARALLARGRREEAAMVLMPVATNPHGGHWAEAKALLAQALAATGQAMPASPNN